MPLSDGCWKRSLRLRDSPLITSHSDEARARVAILATRSAGKLRELVPMFAEIGIAIETLDAAGIAETAAEDALEVHDTFEANALAKAQWFHTQSGGRVVIADDSGLEVDLLHRAPGVRSKRWSNRSDLHGEALDAANNAHLLQMIARERERERERARERARELVGERQDDAAVASTSARYVCAAACVWAGGSCVVRGTTEGVILTAPSGDGGFGYDPYFYSTDLQATFAAVSREAKARVSHRGRAFAHLIRVLTERAVFLS